MKNKKIYIIGPVGSGKTTFASRLSEKCKIKFYELDKVVWDDDNGNIKRNIDEINKLFENILNKNKWIIEDVGRNKFKKGREEADVIYYIRISKIKAYYRVSKRWIKQKLGMERYNHKPTISQLFYFIYIVHSYYKKEKNKLKDLEIYKDKLIFVKKKDIERIINGVVL